MVFVLDVEVKHRKVNDKAENTNEGLEFRESLETEDEKWEQHLFLVDMKTVQEERDGGEEQTQKEVLRRWVSH